MVDVVVKFKGALKGRDAIMVDARVFPQHRPFCHSHATAQMDHVSMGDASCQTTAPTLSARLGFNACQADASQPKDTVILQMTAK